MIDLDKIQHIDAIPTLPSVVTKVLELVFNEKAAANEIATLVESDQGLSAKVLRLVNSVAYGLAQNVSSIKHAINLIGFQSLKHLVLSVSVYDEFMRDEPGKKSTLNKAKLWQHSVSVALVAREIARQSKYRDPDLVYTVGLFHDVGKIIIDKLLPDTYQRLMQGYQDNADKSLVALENELIGDSHDRIGGQLSIRWKLPAKLAEAITHHHFESATTLPSDSLDRHLLEIIAFADVFCWAQGFGSLDILHSPALTEGKLRFVHRDKLNTAEIFQKIDSELKQFADLFNFPLPDSQKFREALIKANMELGRLNTLYILTQKKLERQVSELSALNKAIRLARMSLQIEEIISTLLSSLREGLNFDRAFFFLLSNDKTRANGHSSASSADKEIDAKLLEIPITPQNQRFYSCVHEQMKPFLVQADLADSTEKKILAQFTSEEIGVIPIISQKNVLGFFIFDNLVSKNPVSSVNTETLSIIGNEAGMAIENVRLFEEVKKMAILDDLTQLSNRRQCLSLLQHEFHRSKRYLHNFSVLMIDIDDFKKFNDLYGHDVGDKVLKLVANTIRGSLRKADVAGRFGGEEFLVILPEANSTGAAACAEKLRQAVETFGKRELQECPKLTLSISIGCSEIRLEHENPEEIVKEADIALYQAKHAGKNRVAVYSVNSENQTNS